MIPNPLKAQRWLITGRVQGVGFRPYIYRLAHQHQIQGWVKNLSGAVEIHVQGTFEQLQQFAEQLLLQAPPLAQPQIQNCQETDLQPCSGFAICSSENTTIPQVHVPPDYFTCDDCLNELRDPDNRRYRYPFINCTQCGPRYTLIQHLPYDRPNTSMAEFPLCPNCALEYHDLYDRRFHAQPLACPECGPHLNWQDKKGTSIDDTEAALAATVQALRQGEIVAVKGIGGYHLLCDACNQEAVQRLRHRKARPIKPLALLFPQQGEDGLDCVRQYVQLDAAAGDLLLSPARPIVLLPRKSGCPLPPALAPNMKNLGVMLPYSPLHHILLDDFAAPVVATSANVSGEPVLTHRWQVEDRLSHVADSFLHHNRPILRPADDSVMHYVANRVRPIRLGRGYAPLELKLTRPIKEPLLGVGGHLKNTIALAWDQRLVVSPHIGDLSAPASLDAFARLIKEFQQLYGVRIQNIIHDKHPQYASTRWAKTTGLACIPVQHHHAHASALAAEYPQLANGWLMFVWDGVGYGLDQGLWGGEAFYGQVGTWQRVGHWRPFYLSGGEKAGREPWRSAAALCWEAGLPWQAPVKDQALVYQAWQRRLNCPRSTAAGRLFDAAAALLDLVQVSSYEAQGPIMLETAATQALIGPDLMVSQNEQGLYQLDWAPLLPFLQDTKLSVAERASGFHYSVAKGLCQQARVLAQQMPVKQIGLSGGVFQNKLLTELCLQFLADEGFTAYLAQKLPCNDAGLSVGQIMEVAKVGIA